jgi:pimeloyl-ACP methyl ester carboxylesterase
MDRARRTVILVHGTWHDESCWDAVVAELSVLGVAARTVALPSTDPLADIRATPDRPGRPLPGFADDVAAVQAAIDASPGEVLLCGHSYGGMVISEVGTLPRVTRLIYLAGFCAEPGRSLLDVAGRIVGPGPFTGRQTPAGLSVLSPRTASWFLYHDLPARRRAWRSASVLPSSGSVLTATVARPAWASTPTTYVACLRDRALGRARQRDMVYRVIRAQLALRWDGDHTVILDTGHCPFFSAPGQVAAVVAAASAD